ncbi:glycine betaine ABC transporter substrate-binding protein [Geopsychrobacter electrodiphilus]|uniref:glycine betaine ABC transporter substrate-binding protein n=1 Tax=Geopsychrobacter electrodiphilus TaxID=225196 RepID=UPI00036C6C4B|nr:glycine betaine ABC transporter substrate-binding protein [Geopsychrobacter electrodiphilus]
MKIVSSVLVLLLLLFCSVVNVSACVGKTLKIGTSGTVQQEVLANIIAELISERTGTTVKVVPFKDSADAHAALLKADIDMFVEYTGVSQTQILQAQPLKDATALYNSVKDRYNQDLNLIWLKPFGFDAAQSLGVSLPAEAAPVVRKDTLKKFPALARLINKLGGKIDLQTIALLEKESASGVQPKQVAHGFLKNNRLI